MLPNFEKIINQGFSAPLQVTIPPATIPSWACSFSGLTPEQLGFYYFASPSLGLFSSHSWRDLSVFSLLNERMFVMNVPGSYPVWKISGEMIGGMMSPKLNTYPPELKFGLPKDYVISGKNIKDIHNL